MLAQQDERKFGESTPGSTSPALIEACQQGDYDAFAALFNLHKDRVYSIALRFSGEPAAAMDIAQDTFLKLLAHIHQFRAEARFESWLYRMVVNACIDYQRSRRRWLPLMEDFIDQVRGQMFGRQMPGRMTAVEQSHLGDQVRSQVDLAVAELPPDQRIAVVLRYTEGLSYDEIAAATGVAQGTVASRLNRAHAALGVKLQHLRGGTA